MLYLLEVVDNKYKIYDSDSKEILIKDAYFLSRNIVSGVVALTEESVMAQCFNKLELEVLNCFKDIRKFKMKYTFSSYMDMSYEVSLRRSVPDIIADSYAKPDENCIIEGNKATIIGREIATYRYEFIIKDRKRFDKVITKYIIMRGKT